MTKKSFYKKGRVAGGSGSGLFISIKPDEDVVFAPLEGIDEQISVDLHSWWDINPAPHLVCLGKDCPSCALGDDARLKSYMPVVLKDGTVKVFAYGVSVARQLEMVEDEIGSIAGQVIKIKRFGSGLSTKYQVMPLGKTLDISAVEKPDVIAMLGTTNYDEQLKILANAGLDVDALGKSTSSVAEDDTSGWDEL